MTLIICGATHSSPAENTSLAGSGTDNIWNKTSPAVAVPYTHPLVRRSITWMSQKSLEMCTETLGSETGTNDFDDRGWFTNSTANMDNEKNGQQEDFNEELNERREQLSSVNNHCTRRRSPPRSFPPPLRSISCHVGPSIQMRSHRLDGSLVVTANPVHPKNYLHARRHEGRLVLSFIDATYSHQSCSTDIVSADTHAQPEHSIYIEQVKEPEYVNFGDEDEEHVEGEEEEEEEVEVLDRGTVVEVKVSTQPHQQRGAIKVLRSSIVINKFVGGAPPLSNENRSTEPPTLLYQRRIVPTSTPAVAAAVAASSVSATPEVAQLSVPVTENKVLFTLKSRNREEMLYKMRRCSELLRPLFIWEQCCIANS